MSQHPNVVDVETLFIVRYAMSGKIYRATCTIDLDSDGTERADVKSRVLYGYYRIGVDAFRTEEEAIAAILKMRDKKLLSLEKQRKKLEKLDVAKMILKAEKV